MLESNIMNVDDINTYYIGQRLIFKPYDDCICMIVGIDDCDFKIVNTMTGRIHLYQIRLITDYGITIGNFDCVIKNEPI